MVVGDGPALLDLKARYRDVLFLGAKHGAELASLYAAADVFCLPSVLNETWGIVVNEALNFGLPVVVTDKVGCAPDLVHEGDNGFVVPAGLAGPLAAALERLVADAELRARFGRRSREIVAQYSVEACADGIVAACLA